ncbi:CvpA family protein [Secundilactobacillus odoratitofui]|uniref:CvpA family protein n=1 Tax=Secundilactobacillus odoratitofui TaxID=480930 RepID=UPI0034E24F7F
MVRHVGRDLNLITRLPLIHSVNALLGAATSFIVRYLLIFLILNILLLFPSQWVQQQYQVSSIAQSIVKKTPVMSKQLMKQWQAQQVK